MDVTGAYFKQLTHMGHKLDITFGSLSNMDGCL